MTNLAATHAVGRHDLEVAFERHRPELTGYCYRMLGSTFEADDAVQETMVRAWRGFAGFEGRASLRSWLFRIATNVGFDLLAGRGRRALPMDLGPASAGDEAGAEPPVEVAWLQPVPDSLVTPSTSDADPADVATAREMIRLAFVAALQHLPPRQRAVLILRDVLRWQATEVATLLDMTPTAVHSTLPRARAALAAHDLGVPPAPMDAEHQALLARYVDAFERYDVQALVALLHEDATMSMPPNPQWMQGPDAIARWWYGHGSACRGSRLLPTTANGSAAFAQYRPGGPPGHGGYDAFSIHVVETAGGRLRGIHIFLESRLFPLFGLPARLGE